MCARIVVGPSDDDDDDDDDATARATTPDASVESRASVCARAWTVTRDADGVWDADVRDARDGRR